LHKSPRPLLANTILANSDTPSCTLLAFPPNRDTLGGTAYLILGNEANILIDCPAWDEENQQFLKDRGGIAWLVITHRGGIGQARKIQQAMDCKILIQEQEAYLLPDAAVIPFHREFSLTEQTQAIWTPGHSPGSTCLYTPIAGGVLFSGRHLLPNPQGKLVPLKTSKTFHWGRQIRSVQALRDRFTPATLQYICPGANTGFLRGKGIVPDAYSQLMQLNLNALEEGREIGAKAMEE
jgi:glyoxylase-like metal-dependent hydrolase (beta-lactamase superfamily II)